jgi:hypothetical protein
MTAALSLPAGSSDFAGTLAGVHVPGFAADEGLVRFNVA